MCMGFVLKQLSLEPYLRPGTCRGQRQRPHGQLAFSSRAASPRALKPVTSFAKRHQFPLQLLPVPAESSDSFLEASSLFSSLLVLMGLGSRRR